MEMWTQGVIDGNTAMELLGKDSKMVPSTGGNEPTKGESQKRPASDMVEPAELDEILDQAKRAKNETFTCINAFSFSTLFHTEWVFVSLWGFYIMCPIRFPRNYIILGWP